MNKILYTFVLTISVLLTSCSIYEEVAFFEDGRVEYEIAFDANDLLKAMPDLPVKGKIPTDSIISFADLVKQDNESNSSSGLSPQDKQDLENISPFFMSIKSNEKSKELVVKLYGSFETADKLNAAFTSINNLNERNKEKISSSTESIISDNPVGEMQQMSHFYWDGSTMKRIIDRSLEEKQEIENGKDNNLSQFFMGGKMIVKYHFPRKVASINNEDALLSQDSKTVVIEYPASVFIEPSEQTNIEITTGK